LYKTLVAEHRYASNASNLIVPTNLTWLGTLQEPLGYLTADCTQMKSALREVVLGCQALQDSIKHVVEHSEVPPRTLEAFKKKMKTL